MEGEVRVEDVEGTVGEREVVDGPEDGCVIAGIGGADPEVEAWADIMFDGTGYDGRWLWYFDRYCQKGR